jgi:hypothetical protein
MNENPSAKLFKEPAIWPNMAPWWLVASTEAAALLNVNPTTLHTWRTRGYGPPVVPPMYVRPTAGKPLYYQYGALRTWAASKLGMAYSFDDQCIDFFERNQRHILSCFKGLTPRVEVFEDLFLGDRENMLKGLPPRFFKAHEVHELDISYSRQPKTVRKEELRSMFNGLGSRTQPGT